MKLSWLMKEYHKRCMGKMHPTKIRMGTEAYAEYFDLIHLTGKDIYAISKAIHTFYDAHILTDSRMIARAVEFVVGPTEIVPLDEPEEKKPDEQN